MIQWNYTSAKLELPTPLTGFRPQSEQTPKGPRSGASPSSPMQAHASAGRGSCSQTRGSRTSPPRRTWHVPPRQTRSAQLLSRDLVRRSPRRSSSRGRTTRTRRLRCSRSLPSRVLPQLGECGWRRRARGRGRRLESIVNKNIFSYSEAQKYLLSST